MPDTDALSPFQPGALCMGGEVRTPSGARLWQRARRKETGIRAGEGGVKSFRPFKKHQGARGADILRPSAALARSNHAFSSDNHGTPVSRRLIPCRCSRGWAAKVSSQLRRGAGPTILAESRTAQQASWRRCTSANSPSRRRRPQPARTTPTRMYRTTLLDVVNHYDGLMKKVSEPHPRVDAVRANDDRAIVRRITANSIPITANKAAALMASER